jgi:hypothetical protein
VQGDALRALCLLLVAMTRRYVVPHAKPGKLTPPQVAALWQVKAATVIGWIRSGQLRAVDVSSRGSRRPRYRIDRADLLAFEQARAAVPAPKVQRRRRRPADVIEFF